MNKQQLLELYAEEIKNGEVQKEDLLEYNRILQLEDDSNGNKIIESLKKTHNLFLYFKQNLVFPFHHLGIFYEFHIQPEYENNKKVFKQFKNTLKAMLYTNAFKSI